MCYKYVRTFITFAKHLLKFCVITALDFALRIYGPFGFYGTVLKKITMIIITIDYHSVSPTMTWTPLAICSGYCVLLYCMMLRHFYVRCLIKTLCT